MYYILVYTLIEAASYILLHTLIPLKRAVLIFLTGGYTISNLLSTKSIHDYQCMDTNIIIIILYYMEQNKKSQMVPILIANQLSRKQLQIVFMIKI